MLKTNVYKSFLGMRTEIDKHKWIESEKAGHDIGFDVALVDWLTNHKNEWIRSRVGKNEQCTSKN
jgi:hypothetical protein